MIYSLKKQTPVFILLSCLLGVLVMSSPVFAGGGASSGGSGGSGGFSNGGTRVVGGATAVGNWSSANRISNSVAEYNNNNNSRPGGTWEARTSYNPSTGTYTSSAVFTRESSGGNGGGNTFTPIRTTPPGGGTPPSPPPPPPPVPPTLSLAAEVNDARDYNANTTIRVAPSDKIDLTWNSTRATTCTNNFGGTGLNNTIAINPNAIVPGTSRLFQMLCSGAGGSIARMITAEVPGVVINLTADKNLVRYGETVTYTWTVALSSPLSSVPSTTPYPMNCVLSGGANTTFNATTEPTGSITSEALTNSRQTTLTCTETAAGTGYRVSDSIIIEIIPRSEET